MDLQEFERQVIAGEITDFESYFKEVEDKNDIDAMDDKWDLQRICIENNVYQEKYREWANELVRSSYNSFVPQENNTELQFLLINNNHCLDILIYSDNKKFAKPSSKKTSNTPSKTASLNMTKTSSWKIS